MLLPMELNRKDNNGQNYGKKINQIHEKGENI